MSATDDEVLSRQEYVGGPFKDDPADEEWEFPDASEMTPEEAAKLWDRLERMARETNKRKKLLDQRKGTARELARAAVEASPYTSVRIELEDGREVQITPYSHDHYTVKDPEAFKAWAAEQAERYYDATPRLRDDIFQDAMRMLDANREPLPPGVIRYPEPKISRTTAPKRRR